MKRSLDVADHSRDLGANRYVYAVVSRRARGLSIGINMNPDKVCNYACPYCQVDRTTPGAPPEVDVQRLTSELDALLERVGAGSLWDEAPFDTVDPELRRVADLAFSGDGEPTTPPSFPAAARAARAARDRHRLRVPLRLITNATLFDKARVLSALAEFDELWCKLDAGTPEYFATVDGTRFPFAKLLDNLLAVARERPIVIQSLFLALAGEGPSDDEVDAWAGRIRELRERGGAIDEVQVYTVVRRPADPRVTALPRPRLEQIARRARDAGAPATVYG